MSFFIAWLQCSHHPLFSCFNSCGLLTSAQAWARSQPLPVAVPQHVAAPQTPPTRKRARPATAAAATPPAVAPAASHPPPPPQPATTPSPQPPSAAGAAFPDEPPTRTTVEWLAVCSHFTIDNVFDHEAARQQLKRWRVAMAVISRTFAAHRKRLSAPDPPAAASGQTAAARPVTAAAPASVPDGKPPIKQRLAELQRIGLDAGAIRATLLEQGYQKQGVYRALPAGRVRAASAKACSYCVF